MSIKMRARLSDDLPLVCDDEPFNRRAGRIPLVWLLGQG
jgi:hypothetical protein